jgi:CBS domain containing-hemolysin-like protein
MKHNGFSRVPIVEQGDKNRIIGILMAKSCLSVDPDEEKSIQ